MLPPTPAVKVTSSHCESGIAGSIVNTANITGILSTIADNSCAFAAFSLMKDTFQPLTIEFKINFLSTANGEKLITEADILKAGKSIFHARSDVFCVSQTRKTLVASALVTVKATKAISEI